MLQQIEYDSFYPDSSKKTTNNMALANRPLSTSALQNKAVKCDTCSSHIYPASKSPFQMNNGDDVLKGQFVSIENKYNTNETPISVVFQQDKTKGNHNISVLSDDPFNDRESDYYIGDYSLLQENENKINNRLDGKYFKNKKQDNANNDGGSDKDEKMDIYTNIYVSSITVIALYLVYRLLLK
jgi:hypothetical protein